LEDRNSRLVERIELRQQLLNQVRVPRIHQHDLLAKIVLSVLVAIATEGTESGAARDPAIGALVPPGLHQVDDLLLILAERARAQNRQKERQELLPAKDRCTPHRP